MTPEPHFIRATITQALQIYQLLVNEYIEDIVYSTAEDSADIKYFSSYYEFILANDIITEIRMSYYEFEKNILSEISFLKPDGTGLTRDFLLRIYKDYLLVLNNDAFQHPVSRLCRRMRETDIIKYEIFLSQISVENDPAFIRHTSLTVFLNPRYLGNEYINICGDIFTDKSRSVYMLSETTHPEWTDFLLKFKCDVLLEELEKAPGASSLTTFFVETPFFASETHWETDRPVVSGHLNYAYLYLINKWIESRHPEYVKILLRNFGKLDWRRFVGNVDSEIASLKRFIYCCMFENGYEPDDIVKLWREA